MQLHAPAPCTSLACSYTSACPRRGMWAVASCSSRDFRWGACNCSATQQAPDGCYPLYGQEPPVQHLLLGGSAACCTCEIPGPGRWQPQASIAPHAPLGSGTVYDRQRRHPLTESTGTGTCSCLGLACPPSVPDPRGLWGGVWGPGEPREGFFLFFFFFSSMEAKNFTHAVP